MTTTEAYSPESALLAGSFHNCSDGLLADELGYVRGEIADLKEREAKIKRVFTEREITRSEGKRFVVLTVHATRWSLDVAKVKAEMGEDWYVARSRVTPTTSLRVTERKRVARLAVVALVAEEGGAS